jgi:hypothetical protein
VRLLSQGASKTVFPSLRSRSLGHLSPRRMEGLFCSFKTGSGPTGLWMLEDLVHAYEILSGFGGCAALGLTACR